MKIHTEHFSSTNAYRKWDADKNCMKNMSSTKPKFQWVKSWSYVTHAFMAAGKIYGSSLGSRVSHFASLLEVTLRKTWSQREGPECVMCEWFSLRSGSHAHSTTLLSDEWCLLLHPLKETTDCIFRGLTCCRKQLHVCSV